MTEQELLDLWKEVAGLPDNVSWNEDSLYGYFQRFRPHGGDIPKAFESLDRGSEVLARVMGVFAATAEGFAPGDAYFIVRAPLPASDDDLVALARRQLTAWAVIGEEMEDEEIIGWASSAAKVRVVRKAPEDATFETERAAALYDLLTDWAFGSDPSESNASLMGEAFYSIACDPYLTQHLTWPWHRDNSDAEEPFEPHFELWRRGARLAYLDNGEIEVYREPQG
ncbi:MAG: hypothetical protein AAF604_08270 [Acidobacteriota bacterium]